jgi:hypothetical protein
MKVGRQEIRAETLPTSAVLHKSVDKRQELRSITIVFQTCFSILCLRTEQGRWERQTLQQFLCLHPSGFRVRPSSRPSSNSRQVRIGDNSLLSSASPAGPLGALGRAASRIPDGIFCRQRQIPKHQMSRKTRVQVSTSSQ